MARSVGPSATQASASRPRSGPTGEPASQVSVRLGDPALSSRRWSGHLPGCGRIGGRPQPGRC
jgi:hypothetical protein